MANSKSKVSSFTWNTKVQTAFLLVLFIHAVFSEKCEYEPCHNGEHTMCLYPAKLDKSKPKCSGKGSHAGLKGQLRRAILARHNRLRQRVAQGKAGQPKAANMMKLRWNKELETIAQRYVNSCPPVGNDVCRILKDGTDVNQNSGTQVFKYKEKPKKAKAVASVVDSWFSEIKDMDPSYIDDISHAKDNFGYIGHYTQVVWAETDRLGCGYLEYSYQDPFQYILLDCNYAPAGNLMRLNSPVYMQGEPCSKCPVGTNCSIIYPGLCTAEKHEHKYTGVSKVRDRRNKRRNAGNAVFGGASWGVILVVSILRNIV